MKHLSICQCEECVPPPRPQMSTQDKILVQLEQGLGAIFDQGEQQLSVLYKILKALERLEALEKRGRR